MKQAIFLGVNIDHVATLRQARGTRYPDPVQAVFAAESGGADGITIHLREDRRHIQERDVELIKEVLLTRMNLEMANTPSMVRFAEKISPETVCLVPEKRDELTTEGGLDVVKYEQHLTETVATLKDAKIHTSLFIDPDAAQIEAALRCGAPIVELHTGAYADARTHEARQDELKKIKHAVTLAHQSGLIVNAGHGLNYENIVPIAQIHEINELNIGHSIIARAVFMGLENAVREMKRLMMEAR